MVITNQRKKVRWRYVLRRKHQGEDREAGGVAGENEQGRLVGAEVGEVTDSQAAEGLVICCQGRARWRRQNLSNCGRITPVAALDIA